MSGFRQLYSSNRTRRSSNAPHYTHTQSLPEGGKLLAHHAGQIVCLWGSLAHGYASRMRGSDPSYTY